MGKVASKAIALLALLGLIVGCAAGHCRGKEEYPEKKAFVFKADGSKQCQKKGATTVDKMAEELSDIRVYSQENRSDGMMRAQMCGSPTGKINVYEIRAVDLEKAKAKGFQELPRDN